MGGANRRAGLALGVLDLDWRVRPGRECEPQCSSLAPHLSTAQQPRAGGGRSRVGRLPTGPRSRSTTTTTTTTPSSSFCFIYSVWGVAHARVTSRHDALACPRIGGATNTSTTPAATTPTPLLPPTIQRGALELCLYLGIGFARVLFDVQRHLALLYKLASESGIDEFR